METKELFTTSLEGFYNDSNYKQVFSETLALLQGVQGLTYATRALAVGAGPGLREVELLRRCVPRLESVTFVEPNDDCFEVLRRNVASLLGAECRTRLVQSKVEEWRGAEERAFDVVVMLQSLYGIEQEERRRVLKECLEHWLVPGGVLILSMVHDQHKVSTEGDILNVVFRELNVQSTIDLQDVKDDISAIGKQIQNEFPYNVRFHMDILSQHTTNFISLYCEPRKSDEEIRAAIASVKQKGYNGEYEEALLVLRA